MCKAVTTAYSYVNPCVKYKGKLGTDGLDLPVYCNFDFIEIIQTIKMVYCLLNHAVNCHQTD